MHIRSSFGKASTPSTSASRLSSSSSEDESEVESLEPEVSPPRKHCTSTVRLSTPTSTKKHAICMYLCRIVPQQETRNTKQNGKRFFISRI